jgi:protein TonB
MAIEFSPSGAVSPHRPVLEQGRSARAAGLAAVMALHLVLIVALLHREPARRTLNSVAPIVVSLIAAEARPPTQAPQPRAKTQRHPRVEQAATPPTASNEVVIANHSAAPEVQRPATEVVYAVASAAPTPPPIIPPRFNADYLQNPAPLSGALPADARGGKVLVRVLVSIDGLPERIELKTSGLDVLVSRPHLVKRWKFVPARQGEQKIAAWVVVPIIVLDG